MSNGRSYISSTSVASSTPFDMTTGEGFFDGQTDVQSAIEALRNHTVYVSRTQATTLNGTLTLTINDNTLQFLTGSATGYSVVLPDATTLTPGHHYKIDNITSQTVLVKNGAGTTLFTLGDNSIGEVTLQLNTTAAGSWVWWQTSATTASGVVTYNITTATPFSTSSATYVPITGFSVTPAAGTYGIWYNASSYYTTTPKSHWWAIFNNGVIIANTERLQDTAHSNQTMVDSTMTIFQVAGGQTLDVRVHCDNTGTITVGNRSLLLIRLGA
jgi:hypothetical protein